MKAINIALLMIISIILISCKCKQSVSNDSTSNTIVKEVTKIDTIRVPVEVKVPMYLEPKETKAEGGKLEPTDENLTKFKEGKLNLPPLTAESNRSKAKAWVTSNKLFINLYDKKIDTVIVSKGNALVFNKTITKDSIKDSSSNKIIHNTEEVLPPFYRNYWFWIFVVLILLNAVYAYIKIQAKTIKPF